MSSKRNLQQRFTISCSVLEGVGTEISFLKRRILRVEDGLALLPGNNIAKLIKVWEEKLRADPGIQMEDSSLCLVGSDVTFFRMAVGTCLYIIRDRPQKHCFHSERAFKLHEQCQRCGISRNLFPI